LYSFRQRNEKREKKPWFSIFILGFVGGVIFINLWMQGKGPGASFIHSDSISRLGYLTVEKDLLFGYIIETRLKLVFMMILFSTTIIGICINYIVMGWLGLSMGILLANLAMEFGIKGTFVFIGCVFPHYLVYIPVIIYLTSWCYQICIKLYFPHKDNSIMNGSKKQQFIKLAIELLIILSFLLIGILLESYVNPIFLNRILQIL